MRLVVCPGWVGKHILSHAEPVWHPVKVREEMRGVVCQGGLMRWTEASVVDFQQP